MKHLDLIILGAYQHSYQAQMGISENLFYATFAMFIGI